MFNASTNVIFLFLVFQFVVFIEYLKILKRLIGYHVTEYSHDSENIEQSEDFFCFSFRIGFCEHT